MSLLSREFIAVPDDKKNQIVYKHPDHEIRRFTRAIVAADEVALFTKQGQVAATMGPGQHQVDASEIPGLGILLDAVSGGNMYKAELYFVSTRAHTGVRFGGRVDDVQDAQTGLIVTLRVFGESALIVNDAAKLVTNLTGTVDVTDNTAITGWVSEQLLKAIRTTVTTKILEENWPILGLSSRIDAVEELVLARVNTALLNYGIALTQLGNFDINLAPEDELELKKLATDTARSRLAGGYGAMAQAEMMRGAGAGMAQGGSGNPALLMAGMGMGQALTQTPMVNAPIPPVPGFAGGAAGFVPPAAAVAVAGPAAVHCSQCGTALVVGAKFCSGCGTQAGPTAHSCGTVPPAGAKFCPGCGGETAS